MIAAILDMFVLLMLLAFGLRLAELARVVFLPQRIKHDRQP